MIQSPLVQNGTKSDVESVTSVASWVGVLNGIDLTLGWFGVIPPGAIPAVANGVVAVISGLTTWYGRRRARLVVNKVLPTLSK
jgi:hypothetical protein